MKKTVMTTLIVALLVPSGIIAAFSIPKTARAAESNALDYAGNYCLSFDGVNDSVQFGYSQIFNLQNFTIEAWVKPTYNVIVGSDSVYGHQWGTVAHDRPSPSSESYPYYHGWDFAFNYADGCLYLMFCCAPYMSYHVYSFHTNKAIWYNDSWYAIAATFDPWLPGGNVKFYINGTFDSQDDESYSINTYENAAMQVGSEYGANAYNGLIDEFRMWNYSMTGGEIVDNWGRLLNSSEISSPNLVGYWRLDEDNGTITHDFSIQGNDGVLGANQPTAMPAWHTPRAPIQTIPEFPSVMLLAAVMITSLVSAFMARGRLSRKRARALL